MTPCPAPACAGWGRARAKADAPSHSAPHFPCLRPRPCPPTAESQCAKAECTRQSPLLPVRSPRESPPKTAPLPVRTPRDSLSTAEPPPACVPNQVRKGGVHKAIPAPAREFFPRQPAYRPLLPADGRSAERKGGSAQGNPRSCPCVLPATACLRPSPPRTATRPLPPTAPPPPPKWAPRFRRGEGKPPNGAPPHRNAHTPNAERKRYLHNSRTKTQSRTKRCAQFVIFVFTPCKLLHNFSTVLHRSPRNVPKRA